MKVILNGEAFDFDGLSMPMSEAMALEKAWGRRYAEWQAELEAGTLEAFCVMAWLIWRRDGRDVELRDILEGRADFDLGELLASFAKARAELEAEAVPTSGAAPRTAPAGTPRTRNGTRASSAKS
jgi:hypothetical protein